MKTRQVVLTVIFTSIAMSASQSVYAAPHGVGHGSTMGMTFSTRAQACEVSINSAEADAINQAKAKTSNKYGNAHYNINEKKCECNSNKDGTKWECTGFVAWEEQVDK